MLQLAVNTREDSVTAVCDRLRIVDDDPGFGELIAAFLPAPGCEVDTVGDASTMRDGIPRADDACWCSTS